jgi:hypothetical protein
VSLGGVAGGKAGVAPEEVAQLARHLSQRALSVSSSAADDDSRDGDASPSKLVAARTAGLTRAASTGPGQPAGAGTAARGTPAGAATAAAGAAATPTTAAGAARTAGTATAAPATAAALAAAASIGGGNAATTVLSHVVRTLTLPGDILLGPGAAACSGGWYGWGIHHPDSVKPEHPEDEAAAAAAPAASPSGIDEDAMVVNLPAATLRARQRADPHDHLYFEDADDEVQGPYTAFEFVSWHAEGHFEDGTEIK